MLVHGSCRHRKGGTPIADVLLKPERQREYSTAAALPDLQVPHAFAIIEDQLALRFRLLQSLGDSAQIQIDVALSRG